MTETPPEEPQPPVNPENPTDSGGDITPPTQTEEEARRVAALADIASTEYGMADHITYAQMIYEQPSWVVESVFLSGALDPNMKYTPGAVQAAIDTSMAIPDNRYESTPEGQ